MSRMFLGVAVVAMMLAMVTCVAAEDFVFYDDFEWGIGAPSMKVAGNGGWLPCDSNGYDYSSYGINFHFVEENHRIVDTLVVGKWDPLEQDFTSCYHEISATEDNGLIYMHADILVDSNYQYIKIFVGDPFSGNFNPTTPPDELIGFYANNYYGNVLIRLMGNPGLYGENLIVRDEFLSVTLCYDITAKEYVFLEAIDSEGTHVINDIPTTYTTEPRDLNNVTLQFGINSGSINFGGWVYADNIYVSSMEYAPFPTYIVLKDANGNFITNPQVSIYDTKLGVYSQKWEDEEDGVINITSDSLVSVRTFAGVFTRSFVADFAGGVFNWTIPLRYNIDVHPVDQTNKPVFDVFCGLMEYTPLDPSSFWGMDLSDRGYVPVTNCSGFAMCDIIAEKDGYTDYNVSMINWTSRSAMVKDYRHNIVMVEE